MTGAQKTKTVNETLLDVPIKVINVGLESFAQELAQHGVEAVQITVSDSSDRVAQASNAPSAAKKAS